jgi:hypothetical protein
MKTLTTKGKAPRPPLRTFSTSKYEKSSLFPFFAFEGEMPSML